MPSDGHRDRRRRRAPAWALLLALLLAFLAFGVTPERTRLWDALFDTGHVPLFGLVALAIRGLLSTRAAAWKGARQSWAAFGLAVSTGAIVEVLQVFQENREPSFEDLARDAAGAGAFLLLAAARRPPEVEAPRGPIGRRWAVLLAVALIVASGARLATTLAAYVERARAMPTLAALDGSWWERQIIEEHDSQLTPRAAPRGLAGSFGEPLSRLDLKPGTYPGLALVEPYPDWRPYGRLAFTVVSDLDVPLPMWIRVHDAEHDQRHEDRFNLRLNVTPGVNRFAIPLDDVRLAPDRREMDMARIRGVILFAYQIKVPTHVYLDGFRLE